MENKVALARRRRDFRNFAVNIRSEKEVMCDRCRGDVKALRYFRAPIEAVQAVYARYDRMRSDLYRRMATEPDVIKSDISNLKQVMQNFQREYNLPVTED